MLKTAQELKQQAEKLNLTFIPLRNCSFCDRTYGYNIIFTGDIFLNTSCGCASSNPRQINWEILAESYNRNQPENNPNITQKYLDEQNEIWQFDII